MEIRLQQLLLLCFVICLGLIDRSASKDVIGIAPQDENYYKGLSSGSIKCKDGSKKFTKDQLNDDYCDCSDGSDEPGTSACPNGKFYCKNAGHIPLSIYSSRVNDGICDCCDGSDEYDGKTKCPNTCWEAGKVARDKLKKKIATYQEGVTLRKKEVEEAKLAISKEEAELSKLKNQEKKLKDLVEQLKEHKERIEKAKEEERLKKEKEEKDRKEAEDAKLEAAKAEEKTEVQEDAVKSDVHDKIGLLNESPAAQDVVEGHDKDMKKVEHDHKSHKDELVGDEVEHDDQSHKDESVGDEVEQVPEDSQEKDTTENTESLSKEELGRVVASRWMDKKSEQTNEDVDAGTKSNYDSSDEGPTDSHGEEYNEYDSEDEHKYDDDDTEDQIEDIGGDDHDSISSYKSDSDDDSDFSATSSPSWMEKIQRTVKDIFRAVNLFQTPVNISNAAHVRKEYDESSAKLSKVQSRISSLEKKLKQDFGPEKEFYSFYGQCFETKQNKYTYKICPFKDATQVEGYSTTRLGNWDKFADSYRTIQFSSGDKCWNGPDRSIKVKLRCGLKNELTDVDEPSRCEYIAFLATPALCLEEKLKELQDKLEAMNKQQPEGHDEL